MVNLYLLFGGICGDPGVRKETYLHHSKKWFSGDVDLFTHNSDDEENKSDESEAEDEETGASKQ